jgi:competence protein ComEC
MGALGVMGGMFGRRQNGLNSLGLASLGMMLVNPNVLWDIGFQLSVGATLGLVLYAQPIEERLVDLAKQKMSDVQAEKIVGPICEFFLFSLAAQVMTLPIIAYHFRNVSWISLLANPLILPPQSLVMILGGIALLFGLLLPGLGLIMAVIAQPFVTYTIRMVTWLGKLPGADLILPNFHPLWILIYFVILFILTLMPKDGRKKALRKILSYEVGFLFLLGMVIFVWNRALARPDNLLHLTLLDSEGTILIQTPGGRAVLIGGGDSPSHLQQALGQFLPPGGHELRVVVVGSLMKEDLVGLTGDLRQVPSDMILWVGDPGVNQTSEAVYAAFNQMNVPIIQMETGQKLDLGDGILLNIGWVGDRGSVLWLTWGNFTALLPSGKIEDQWLEIPEAPDVVLLKDGITAENLLLDHINLWSPLAILLPLDDADMPLWGEHPVLSLLDDYPLVTSLEYGWVTVSTDGINLWVSGDRR